jgi:hypothetical protein
VKGRFLAGTELGIFCLSRRINVIQHFSECFADYAYVLFAQRTGFRVDVREQKARDSYFVKIMEKVGILDKIGLLAR